MNKKELEAYMKKYGDTQETLAYAIGLTRATLNRKINEKNGAVFTSIEIAAIKKRYNLSAVDTENIFFSLFVS